MTKANLVTQPTEVWQQPIFPIDTVNVVFLVFASFVVVVVTISEVDVAAIFHDVLLTVHNRKTGAQKVLFSVLFWSTWPRNSYSS